jgi:uncharacterized membrane protein HdeD (DUF308 family)
MVEVANPAPATEHASRRKWFLALGVLLMLLGIAGGSIAGFMQLTSLLIFGPLLLVSAVLQSLVALFAANRKESLIHLAAAGLEMALGFFIMANPLERIIDLINLIAVFLIAIGLARLARSLVARSGERAWILIAGAIALVLGICVWIGGPAAKLAIVGACIAADFFFHGVTWFAVALKERKAAGGPIT